jgi:hypothetical protein
MSRVDPLPSDQQRGQPLLAKAIWICALVVALHPVSHDGLWWELSKGRAVTGGRWTPTATLLAGTVSWEGPWLSGVGPFLLFDQLGPNGLMLFKVAGALLLAGLLLRCAADVGSDGNPALMAVVIALGLLAAREAWEPGPICFDVLGLASVFVLVDRMRSTPGVGASAKLVILMVLWSNLGERSLLGVAVVATTVVGHAVSIRGGLVAVGLSLLACCVTPAGWRGPLDSLVVMFPQTVESTAVLVMSGWSPWYAEGATAEVIAFVGLSAVCLWRLRCEPTARLLAALVVSHLLATAATGNLPVAATWLAFVISLRRGFAGSDDAAKASVSQDDAPQSPSDVGATGPIPEGSVPTFAASMLAIVGVIGLASQPWSGCSIGLGWGIESRLNPDAFAASIKDIPLRGTAHCVGLREAGLLVWHASPAIKPFDTPATALRAGRLKTHVLLTSDLSSGWQVQHPRAEGSSGGWWTVCQERGITHLVVPSESVKLVAALEPTVWKPLSLTAVSLVYGRAGDPDCTPRIVQTLSLRQLVDRGGWTYDGSVEAGDRPLAFWPWAEARSARGEGLRMARLFRAMGLSIGALKVLQGMPDRSSGSLSEEFYENQVQLGYRERIACGRSSAFRQLAATLCGMNGRSEADLQEILVRPDGAGSAEAVALRPALTAYVAGDLKSAIQLLPTDSAEALYARSWLLLEGGDPASARRSIEEFLERFKGHRLERSARLLLDSLPN